MKRLLPFNVNERFPAAIVEDDSQRFEFACPCLGKFIFVIGFSNVQVRVAQLVPCRGLWGSIVAR